MDSDQIKKGVVRARRSGTFDGWFLLAESFLIGIVTFAVSNNAVVGLAAAVIAFKLLSQRVIGTVASIAFAGLLAWLAGQNAYLKFQRWDIGVAVGIITGVVAHSFHSGHVRAFERS